MSAVSQIKKSTIRIHTFYRVFNISCGVYISFHQCVAKFVVCFEILMENGRS